jgi:Protein of unknown function (DUF3089)
MVTRALLAAFLWGLAGSAAFAQSPAAPSPSPAPDYAKAEAWLCRPGRADACAQDQSATVVAEDGALKAESFSADPDAPIDCFYVYPTVSNDPTPNSDMTANAEELYVVQQQFARFGSKCRTFAPLYRQVTLASLRAVMMGQPLAADRAMAYSDVKAAWEHYLAHDNNGRGVVLIGHSQGAGVLTALVANEIEGKPVARRLVAAYILGANLPTPRGALVGGAFKSTPLCTSKNQTGCVVTYVSFRASSPPPPNARFGTAQMNSGLTVSGDMTAACVNPAALLRAGAGPTPLRSYLAATGRAIVTGAAPPVWSAGKTVSTPFVSTPGLLSAECVSTPTHSYLSVATNADPADARIDEIPGDVLVGGRILPDWGLHLIDVNVAMGDLVELVGEQSAAYRARR